MERKVQVRAELEQTRVLALEKNLQAPSPSNMDIMSKRIQQQEEHLEVMVCKMAKMHGYRLSFIKMRTIIFQENWNPEAWNP